MLALSLAAPFAVILAWMLGARVVEWWRRRGGGRGAGALFVLALALLLPGCVSALSTATTATNSGRALLEVAHDTITESCVPAYQKAATSADLARVDAVCLPAKTAYEAARAAWLAAVAAVLAASSGGDPAQLQVLVAKMSAAGVALAVVLAKVSP